MTADVDRLSGCSRMKSLREPSYLRAFIPVLRSDLIAILRAASSRASSTASASCSPFRPVDGLSCPRSPTQLHCLRILFSVPTASGPPSKTSGRSLHCLRILFSVPTATHLRCVGRPRPAPLPPHPVLRSDQHGHAQSAPLRPQAPLPPHPVLRSDQSWMTDGSSVACCSTASASCSPFRRPDPLAPASSSPFRPALIR